MLSSSVKYLPEWTPGAYFKKFGAKGRAMQEKVHWWPWNEVNARYVSILVHIYTLFADQN
jgi:hypothetical protein